MTNQTSLSAFETDPIGRLVFRFSLPAVISMVVSALYNIVDQVFIGQSVGFLGNAATNINFPLTTVFLAVSTMIADGCVAYFSLKLGDQQHEEAAKTMGNGISLSVLVGILFFCIAQLFLPSILLLCGGIPGTVTFAYAMAYGRITLVGMPLHCISIAINGLIRSQGNPRYSMLGMLSGCIVNVILDAWFVLGLHWGVPGAAWATVIGQFISFLFAAFYLPKFRHIPFKLENAKLDAKLICKFLPLGLSSFCTQFVTAIVIICFNNLFVKYGTLSAYGPDIPLAAQGIALKVNSIVTGFMVGLGVGSQPIIGYNYGAKRFDRVRSAYLHTIAAGLAFGLLGWACFQLFPQQIVALFGQENELYNQFAIKFFREFLMLVFLSGFLIPSGTLFQAVGKPVLAMIASLARNLFFFIPFGYLLGYLMGIQGLLYAGPLSDACSSVVVTILIVGELQKLNRLIRGQTTLADRTPPSIR